MRACRPRSARRKGADAGGPPALGHNAGPQPARAFGALAAAGKGLAQLTVDDVPASDGFLMRSREAAAALARSLVAGLAGGRMVPALPIRRPD